jgi:glycosyltransferase involved in cell wall biosynthesis
MCPYKSNLVSVIIPAFNSERYLSDAVESVLNQTYKNFELIVVNDGSTDRTEEILKQYFDRIQYIYQHNKGVAAARNTGIRVSKGEYVAFLDSDDIWAKNNLRLQINYLKNNPDIGLIYGEIVNFNGHETDEELWSVIMETPRPKGHIFQDLILACLFQTSTVMVRRRVLDTVGFFNESLPLGEDYDLWLRIAANHKVGYVPDMLCKYRRHASSLTATNLLEMPWELKVVERALKMFPQEKEKIPSLKLRKRFAKTYFHNGYAAFLRGQYSLANSSFRKSLSFMPFNTRAIIYFLISRFSPRHGSIIINFLKQAFSKNSEKVKR